MNTPSCTNAKILRYTVYLLLLMSIISCNSENVVTKSSPTLTINGPTTVIEREYTSLIAIANDADGVITKYQWQQTQGILIDIVDATNNELNFIAPEVTHEETLIFELIVTDNDNNQSKQSISVSIIPNDIVDISPFFTDEILHDCLINTATENNWTLVSEFTDFTCLTKAEYSDTKSYFYPIHSTNGLDKLIHLQQLTLQLAAETNYDVNFEKLVNLKEFSLSSPWGMTTLNLVNQTLLESLYIDSLSLNSVNIENSSKLSELSIFSNSLIELELPASPNITSLVINHTELLEKLDSKTKNQLLKLTIENVTDEIALDNLSSLTFLKISENQSVAINLSEQKSLKHLILNTQYYLTSLDLSAQSQLTELVLSWNQLSALDLTTQKELEQLSIEYNYLLTNLYLPNDTNLTYLEIINNDKLSSIDLSAQNTLTELNISKNNTLSDINIQHLPQLTKAILTGNNLTTINIDGLTYLTYIDISNNPLTNETKQYLESRKSEQLTIIY